MMTIAQQNDQRARRVVKCLPMHYVGPVQDAFVIAVFGPMLMANHALPAPRQFA